jgi:dTDP-4-amino-4,6-dideoxygalactose transaminase
VFVFLDLPDTSGCLRWGVDRIVKAINAEGVPCDQGSCSEVYLEKAFDGTGWRPAERLPVARELGETSIMFLVHPTLTQAEVDKTCEVVRRVMGVAGVGIVSGRFTEQNDL